MIYESSSNEVEKGWGKETIIVNNDSYCGKILSFKAGSKFSLHFHSSKHETFYVLKGFGIIKGIKTEDASVFEINLNPGVVITIPPLSPHQIFTSSDMEIIEFSTHHEDFDSYRVAKGDSQK